MTDLRNKVRLVYKSNITVRLSKESRSSGPIDIIGRIEAEVAENILPNLVVVSSRIV
jgi:hypothetical protein